MDLRGLPDELLDRAVAQLDAGRPTSITPAEQAALRAEHARRRGSKPPDNVAANLDAAASPITPDPSVGSKPAAVDPAADLRARMLAAGYTEDEADVGVRQESGMPHAFQLPPSDATLRRGATYMRDQDRKEEAFDRSLDGAYGTPDSAATKPGRFTGSHGATYSREANGSAYAPLTNFQPGATVMVDGVEVPAFDVGDGTLRYRLGDVKRAQEAKQDAEWRARNRAAINADKERYGWDKPFMLRTPAQIDAHNQRRDAERRTRESPAYMQAQARRMAEAANVTYEEALALLESDAEANRQAVAANAESAADDDSARWAQIDSVGAGRKKLAGMASQRRATRNAETKEFIRRRNMLAGGSQNITSDNRGMWNQLALLPAEDQIRQLSYALPGGSLRAGVDARQLDQAARFAQQAITGALAGAGQADMAGRVAAQRSRDLARDDFDKWFDKNVGTTPGAVRYYTWDQYDARVTFLMNQYGISRPEAESIAGSRGRPSVSRSAGAAPPPSGAPGVGPDIDSDANPLPTTTW